MAQRQRPKGMSQKAAKAHEEQERRRKHRLGPAQQRREEIRSQEQNQSQR